MIIREKKLSDMCMNWAPLLLTDSTLLCYIKGQSENENIKRGNIWCCVRSGSSRPTAAVTWSIKFKPKSQSLPLSIFSSFSSCSIKKSKRCGCLCVYTHQLVYTHTRGPFFLFYSSAAQNSWTSNVAASLCVIRSIVRSGDQSIMSRFWIKKKGSQRKKKPSWNKEASIRSLTLVFTWQPSRKFFRLLSFTLVISWQLQKKTCINEHLNLYDILVKWMTRDKKKV